MSAPHIGLRAAVLQSDAVLAYPERADGDARARRLALLASRCVTVDAASLFWSSSLH